LADDPQARGKLDLTECYIDATFVVAKKGAPASETPSRARALNIYPRISFRSVALAQIRNRLAL